MGFKTIVIVSSSKPNCRHGEFCLLIVVVELPFVGP